MFRPACRALFSHWREMTALALSVLRGIVENGLEMEKVYVYLPQVSSAFSNIFASILLRSPISCQRLFTVLIHCFNMNQRIFGMVSHR